MKISKSQLIRISILAAYTICYVVIFVPDANDVGIALATLPVTMIALWFGILVLLSSKAKRHWYEPDVLFNTAVFYYCIKGLTLAYGDKSIYLRALSWASIHDRYTNVAIYVSVGLLLFNLGYKFGIRVFKRKRVLEQLPATCRIDRPRTFSIRPARGILFLTVVGLVSMEIFFSVTGTNILTFIENPIQRSYLTTSTIGAFNPFANFWRMGMLMLPVASLFWLAAIGVDKKSPGIAWWFHFLGCLGLVFMTGSRSDFIGFIFATLLVQHLLVSRIRATTLLGITSAAIGYAYLISTWRSIVSVGTGSLEAHQAELMTRAGTTGLYSFLTSTDLSDIRLFVLISDHYGSIVPLKFGSTLISIFFLLVPRTFWPGKPVDLGLEVGQLFMHDSITGTPPGFFAEMFMNFHVTGVLVGGLLLGVLVAYLFVRAFNAKSQLRGVLFYAVLAPSIILLPAATFTNILGRLLPWVFGIYVASLLSEKILARESRGIIRTQRTQDTAVHH